MIFFSFLLLFDAAPPLEVLAVIGVVFIVAAILTFLAVALSIFLLVRYLLARKKVS
jgi:hypothetical protein